MLRNSMDTLNYTSKRAPSPLSQTFKLIIFAAVLLQALQCVIRPAEGISLPDTLPRNVKMANMAAFEEVQNQTDVIDESATPKVPVSTVGLLTLGMAVATGLGAVPFFFVQLEPRWAGICNGVAAGVMIAASFDLIQEGQRFGGGSWVVMGILAGGLFILASQRMLQSYGEVSMLDVKGADVRKMILVVSIMTLHSFGEGSGVGVSFAGPKGFSQGLMVTIAIAVHNIPEGLAVSMVLSQQGLSAKHAMLWSIFTSLPQPIVAVPAFICAEAFQKFLPFCMGFGAGCMIWMVMAEVMPDSFRDASHSQVASAATLAVAFMEALSALLESTDGAPALENINLLLAYLSFGVGPFIGALVHALLVSGVNLPVRMATGIGTGVACLLAIWRPMQLLLSGRMSFFVIVGLTCTGALLHYGLRNFVESRTKLLKTEIIAPSSVSLMNPMARRAFLASFMIWFQTFAEGLAMGVAAPQGYSHYLVLPIALHGFPRGVGVGSIIYGGTSSKEASFVGAALTSMMGPLGAICAALGGLTSQGLEGWNVLACGALFPMLSGSLVRRALKVDPKNTYFGLLVGTALAFMCLTTTRLVCLHTPYCNTASQL